MGEDVERCRDRESSLAVAVLPWNRYRVVTEENSLKAASV